MGFPFDANDMAFPGIETVLETVQNQYWWGKQEQQTFLPATISGAARDAGNTVTDVLRGGLLLGRVTATGVYKEWNPTGTDGSEVLVGILPAPLKMTDNGTNTDRWTYIHVAGNLYSDRLLVPGNADEGIASDANEYLILNQLTDRRFVLDKHVQYGNPLAFRPRYFTAAENTAHAATALVSDHGRTFYANATVTAGLTLTLPAAVVGLTITLVNGVAFTLTVVPASGSLATPGNMAANTAAITVGESATFIGTAAGQWVMVKNCEATD